METAVSTITDQGPIYRGVPAVGLAAQATLEQAATLLWNARTSDPFAADNLPVLSKSMERVLAAAAGESPIARAIAVLAFAGDADPKAFNRSADGRLRDRCARHAADSRGHPEDGSLSRAAASAGGRGLGAGQQDARGLAAPRARAAGGSRTERVDLCVALRDIDRAQPLRCHDCRAGCTERPQAWRGRAIGCAFRRQPHGRGPGGQGARARGAGRSHPGFRPHGLQERRSARRRIFWRLCCAAAHRSAWRPRRRRSSRRRSACAPMSTLRWP